MSKTATDYITDLKFRLGFPQKSPKTFALGHSFRDSSRLNNCKDIMEKRVKLCVANALPQDPARALNQHKSSSIEALVLALEIAMS